MQDSNIAVLADTFMNKALKVQAGENVWIEFQGDLGKKLADHYAAEVTAAKANPVLVDTSAAQIDAFLQNIPADTSEDTLKAEGAERLSLMKTIDAYIRIDDGDDQEKITASDDIMSAYRKFTLKPMSNHRVNNTRWLVTSSPTPAFAKACGMSYTDFETFYVSVCTADYPAMGEAVKPLQKIMREGKSVHIKGQDTDLTFSIEGIDAVPCTGSHNIPDGECFTAPVKDSINGTIAFGPSKYLGSSFDSITLTFKDGQIIDAVAATPAQTKTLNTILDTDDGARYVGEFAIGFNPFVKNPIGDILFDEKIDGSLHMAMGACYDEASNGNDSAIHWDMVHIQRPEYGGGEIWIDDTLIRKDGKFVVNALSGLNPEKLSPA